MDGKQTSLDRFMEPDVPPKRGRKVKAAGSAATSPATATKSAGTAGGDAQILSYRHPDLRMNNSEVGVVSEAADPAQPQTVWFYDPHLDLSLQLDSPRATIERLIDDALTSGDADSMRLALEELKRLQSPYLAWTGKAERTSFDVDTVSLHVHERMDPMSILLAVRKEMKQGKAGKAQQVVHPAYLRPPSRVCRSGMPLTSTTTTRGGVAGWWLAIRCW